MTTKLYSQRQQKVSKLITIAINEILIRGKMLDERLISCPITITKVIITADLRIAKCYYVPFNTNLSNVQLIDALNSSKHSIRYMVSQEVQLKYSPEIRFYYDHSFDNASRIEKLLDKLNYG